MTCRWLRQFYLVSLASLSACGPSRQDEPSAPLIYGGTPVAAGDFAAVVGLAFQTTENGPAFINCTGTLIAPDVVLTADHCLDGADVSRLSIYTGLGNEGGEVPTAHAVSRAVASPELRAHPLGYGDLGLVFLTTPITDIAPIELTKSLDDQLTHNVQATATLVGYGYRDDLGHGIKFQVETSLQKPTSHEAIAGGYGRDACAGDSGGPAFAGSPLQVVGVVSRSLTFGCGDGGYISLVSDGICWIESEMGVPLPGPSSHCAWKVPAYNADALQPTMSTFIELCHGRGRNATARETAHNIQLGLGNESCEATATKLWTATKLSLDYLMIRDLSPLAGLSQLEQLSLKGNRVTDVSPLQQLFALKSLNLVGNTVDDTSPLVDLETHGLAILGKRRQVKNFVATVFRDACLDATLAEAPRQTVKAILAKTIAEDCITANQRLLSMTKLSLRERGLTDLTPLAKLEQIVVLDLTLNPLTDLSPLLGFESLMTLNLTDTGITDVSQLAPLIARGLVITGVP